MRAEVVPAEIVPAEVPAAPAPPPASSTPTSFGEALDPDWFRRAFTAAPVGTAIASLDGHFLEVNGALCELLGFAADDLRNMSQADLAHPEETYENIVLLHRLRVGEMRSTQLRRRFRHASGTTVWVALSMAVVHGPADRPVHLILQFADVSEQVHAEAALVHQALHDPLTGLPNRTLAIDRVGQALERSRRHDGELAVLFLDVDRFKLVNDSLGHDAGDHLLVELSRRLRAVVRPGDTVARLGGDEFVVLAEELNGPAEATAVAEHLRTALAAPMRLGAGEISPTVSIGIAMGGADALPEQLLRDADTAMYRAKERGKDRWELFDGSLRERVVTQVRRESELRRALTDGGLAVLYQPIRSLATDELVGVEALVRLLDGDQVRAPGEFLDVAEDTGLIVPIGTWVLEQACVDAAAWLAELGPAAPQTVAVNLSARQLATSALVSQVVHALETSGLAAERLRLELTESILMEATPGMLDQLGELRRLGVHLGIDDFGTGYSSLTYLRRFPVDFVKVDRAFVSGIGHSREDEAIVRAVVGLGRALGLDTVAEGVETDSQAAVLRRMGCRHAQGFWYSRPVSPKAIAELAISAIVETVAADPR